MAEPFDHERDFLRTDEPERDPRRPVTDEREEGGAAPAERPASAQWPLRPEPVRRRPPRPEPPVHEPEFPAEPESPPGPEPAAEAALAEPEPEPEPEVMPEVEHEAAPEPEPAPVAEREPDSLEHAGGVFSVPEGFTVLEGEPFGRRRSVGVVVARFNREITKGLLTSALDALTAAGVQKDAITVMPVPGAFELPLAAMALAKTRRYACVVALGCVIRGDTPHFDFVAGEAASGLQLAAIETGVPVAFGVLTCETLEQAEARIDRGADAARTALEMADVFAQLRAAAAAR
jgi:6,7-dimethyl-8-ribityllumazine synthase